MLLLAATMAFQPSFFVSMMATGVRLMEELFRNAR